MSTNRVRPDAGWSEGHKLAACRCCGGPIPKGRRTFCGGARHRLGLPRGTAAGRARRIIVHPGRGCVHEWLLRSSAPYARVEVEVRDRGVCALCGCDTERLKRQIAALQHAHHRVTWPPTPIGAARAELVLARAAALLARHRFPVGDGSRSALFGRAHWWEADHTVPVVLGGGECGLENLRTLCVPCHRDATAELNRRRAAERRAAKQPTLPRLAGGAR